MNLQKLKGTLAENNITQRKLAAMLNLTEKTMHLKMTGKTDFKSKELKAIADVCNVKIDIFFS